MNLGAGHRAAARWLVAVAELALRAVGPRSVAMHLVRKATETGFDLGRGYDLVALGKAAAAQADAWLAAAPAPDDHRVLVPRGYGGSSRLRIWYGEHPVPGPGSFRAGAALWQWLSRRSRRGTPLVVFSSGGASAAVEAPANGWTTAEVVAATERLLGEGDPIEVINPIRAQWSRIKAGGILTAVGRRPVLLAVQSDVPAGLESWVGSGCFDPGPYPVAAEARRRFAELFPGRTWRELNPSPYLARWEGVRVLVGDNATVLRTAAELARREGLSVELHPESLSGEACEVGARIADVARTSEADLLLFGGEPMVTLGSGPVGRGGRLGELALGYGLAAWVDPPYPLLALASDGKDGRSAGAGALWLPGPFDRAAAARALADHDADRFLRRMQWLVRLGPTGVNVRDLVLVLRRPEAIRAIEV